MGDSSSGSKPASSTAGAASRSAYVTPPAAPEARNDASSALCGRDRKSMSLVPSAIRANAAYAYRSSTVPLPPASTPAARSARPRAAASIASGHDAGCSAPSAPRTSGPVNRSGRVEEAKAQRPLSQLHSSFTSGSSPARRRSTSPRRWSTRSAHPLAQCSHEDGVDVRSNGRARNRYLVDVSAPTGQICTVFPEK